MIEGFIKIWEPETGNVIVDKKNAIHYENISIAMANALADRNFGFVQEMHFGNGASSIDSTGIITYLAPNVLNQNADLYNPTYSKIVNDNNPQNTDPGRNKIEVRHVTGKKYTDIEITCTLDYGEPSDQQAFDNSTNFNGEYVFDEIGLKTWQGQDLPLRLVTHVIFHPVQKSLNRQIQIEYTVRIQTLTNLSAA